MTDWNCSVDCLQNGHCPPIPPPVVRTSYGDVVGIRRRLNSGVQVEVFLGIPFAKPPIGELRFEKPVPPSPWFASPLRAFTFGPAATPLNPEDSDAPFSEDCLQLNIFRPTLSAEPGSSSPLLPVMVYIHGGGFAEGSARQYGHDGWVENFAPQGILVVTVQYRLGPFGFLSFGHGSVLPGNLGLWDICQALRFVHNEIPAFGGDSGRVTAAGLSAGGAAAAFMTLSPHTRDLICGSVEMSGTALAEWAASSRTEEASREFVGRALDSERAKAEDGGQRGKWQLAKANMEEAKRKLKALTAEQLLDIAKAMGTSRADPNLLVWGPCIDGDFLPRDVPALVREVRGANKPVLMGVTAEEAIYFTIQAKDPFINPFGIARECLASFGTDQFRSFVHNVVLGGEFRRHFERKNAQKLEQILRLAERKISAFYLCEITHVGHKKSEQNGTEQNKVSGEQNQRTPVLKQYSRLVSDLLFTVPLFRMAHLRKRHALTTFLYFNDYFNKCQFEPWVPFGGATHGNEYPYLNGLFPVGEFQFTEADRQHRAILVQMLSSFVRNGRPSLTLFDNAFLWPSNERDDEGKEKALKFVRIGNGTAEFAFVDAVEQSGTFWAEFSCEFGFDLIRGIAYESDEETAK